MCVCVCVCARRASGVIVVIVVITPIPTLPASSSCAPSPPPSASIAQRLAVEGGSEFGDGDDGLDTREESFRGRSSLESSGGSVEGKNKTRDWYFEVGM